MPNTAAKEEVEAAFQAFVKESWPWAPAQDAPIYEIVRKAFTAGFDCAAFLAVRFIVEKIDDATKV